MRITRRYELDMGHRVPGHGGKCRRIHGHRYVVLATAEGPTAPDGLEEESGMVLDFGALKEAMVATLEQFDHQLVLWREDPLAAELLARMPPDVGAYPIRVPVVPTAERLAEWWAGLIDDKLVRPVRLVELLVYETPNCSATWRAGE